MWCRVHSSRYSTRSSTVSSSGSSNTPQITLDKSSVATTTLGIDSNGDLLLSNGSDLTSEIWKITPTSGDVRQEGSLKIKEAASADSDDASYGQLWVKSDSPNNLYFTNDAGNDVQITNGSSIAGTGGGGTQRWSVSTGGFRTNNTSTTNFYFQFRINGENWSNIDSSPTSLSRFDFPAVVQ